MWRGGVKTPKKAERLPPLKAALLLRRKWPTFEAVSIKLPVCEAGRQGENEWQVAARVQVSKGSRGLGYYGTTLKL